jgi:hypothetical protein
MSDVPKREETARKEKRERRLLLIAVWGALINVWIAIIGAAVYLRQP